MKIIVLGGTGMLGHAVAEVMCEKYGENNVYSSFRTFIPGMKGKTFYYDPLVEVRIPPIVEDKDTFVINCIGVIKPFIKNDPIQAIYVNSIFPRQLSSYCDTVGFKLIHITTDCVFSGKDGQYTENSEHDCTDIYGKTKSLGESEDCMVIRTSIIGEELHKNASLIAWARSQTGKEVRGFTNHLWNGITTKQYGVCCSTIIDNSLFQKGLFHIFSPEEVTKYRLLQLLSDTFSLELKITPYEDTTSIDRTLRSVKELCRKLNIPDLNAQLRALISIQ